MSFTPSAALLYASGLRRFVLGLRAAEAGQHTRKGHVNDCEASTDKQVLSTAEAMREVNLAIFELGNRQHGGDGLYTFFCECGDPDCRETIRLHLHRFDPSMPAGSVLAHVPDVEQEPMS